MEDSQIIELYWQRSESAIAETAKKYGKLCRHIAMNIVGNLSDAEECENDTYVSTWNSIPPTRPNVFSAFLTKIARNIALNRYEYNKAAKRNNEFDLVLDEFLGQLPKEKRVMFVRRYWYSDTVKDISKRLQISESKVKTTLFRVRNELQDFLTARGVMV